MSYLKEPKTFDEQLEILKNRGLIINVLESIEISFRTYITYTLAMRYGASGYLNECNFIKSHFHRVFLENLEREKNNNSNKLFIKHHNEKYNGQLPIWVAAEIMSFGMVSKLYSNMLPIDKSYIKANLCKVNPKLVNSWLQSLTNLRNHCAHYGRVYGYHFPVTTIKEDYIGYELDNRKIFAIIIAMKYLINDQDTWNKLFINLQKLILEYDKYIELRMIGFPENWIEILSKRI